MAKKVSPKKKATKEWKWVKVVYGDIDILTNRLNDLAETVKLIKEDVDSLKERLDKLEREKE